MAVVPSFTSVEGVNLQVTFTDTSTGSPDRWFWDFGDGYTSTSQNPVHVYEGAGRYKVLFSTWISTSLTNAYPTLTLTEVLSKPYPSGNYGWSYFLSTGWNSGGGGFAPRYNAGWVPSAPIWGWNVLADRSFIEVDLSPYPNAKAIFLRYSYSPNTHGLGPTLPIIRRSSQADIRCDGLGGNEPGGNDDHIRVNWNAFAGVANFQWEMTDITEHAFQLSTDTSNGNLGYTWTSGSPYYDTFDVQVVTGWDGGTIEAFVATVAPIIDFTGTPLLGTAPLEVTFEDTSNINAILSKWDFGDGVTIITAGNTNPVNVYVADSCNI